MALRVRRAIDDPDCSLDHLAKLIQAEPLLAARVVGMANSVTYNRSGRAIADVRNAVTRIGFKTIRALATAVVVRQMEDMPREPAHRQLAIRLWEHTAQVASLAYVIAKRVTRQDPDTAFFAAIVHEVGGFYLISRAADFPGLLDGQLPDWEGEHEARIGRAVLKVLGVPEAVVTAIEALWEGYLAMPPETLGDTLLLADQLASVESPLSQLAGLGREGTAVDIDVALDDETLSGILKESAEELESLNSALRS
jgi:HD-like signal output (HDOD) protein